MENTTNLHDLSTAYEYKKNSELRFTYFIFKILRYPPLVSALSWLANAVLRYNIPVKSLIRNTVFKVFCSGEDINEAFRTILKLEKYKVKSVLDYVAEGEKTEKVFDENREIIIENITRLGAETAGNSVSVKFTSLEDPDFLVMVNALFTQGKPFGNARYDNFIKRINSICASASENRVTLYFDAEDRNMQDIFDHIVEQMMERYNIKEAIIYNTLQMYLKDRLQYLERLLAASQKKGYMPGIKLVRGAYVEKERELAARENRESPVYDNKAGTDRAFDTAVKMCLAQHHRVYTCVASHNEKSTLFALQWIERFEIKDHYKKVKFSQLFGMRDNLTFNLGAGGFNSSKYLPYGEVKKAIPYLIRRAEENSSIGEQLGSELVNLKNELVRRKKCHL